MSLDLNALAGSTAWQGAGVAIPDGSTSDQAIKLAGLDWDVETAPIVTNDQKKTSVDDYRVTRRMQDNAILGVVPKRFKPIQNREAFTMFDNVISQGRMGLTAAGQMRGGSRVFIVAKMPDVLEIGKGIGDIDVVERYLLLSNAHDGTRPLQMVFTPIRVACENTLNLALNVEKSGDEKTKLAPRARILHNSKAGFMMKQAEKTMGKALQYYTKFGEFSEVLYRKQLGTAQVKNIIAEVFPPNKKRETTPAIVGHRTMVEDLFTSGKGHEKIAGSAWALINAFAEYADHGYATRKANKTNDPAERSYSIWMGGALGMKQRATNVIAEAVV